jgi:hypothetical protein
LNWRHFELLDMTLVELEYELDALSGLVLMHDVEPVPYKRSLDYAFTFPPQAFKLVLGKVLDQQMGETHMLVAIEDDRIYLRRGKDARPPAPAALIPPKPIDGGPLRKALVALVTELADGGDPSRATRSIVRREPPRLNSGRLARTAVQGATGRAVPVGALARRPARELAGAFATLARRMEVSRVVV